LAKIGVTIALVNTSQVGKILAHSINLVNPIAVIAGEEVRAAIDEARTELKVAQDRFHWFADLETRKNAGIAPQGYVNLA
ncbi:long-chain-acyl-CoA synthetase, partial [Acinetobacter variabilis]